MTMLLKDRKSWLKDWKSWLKHWKSQFLSKVDIIGIFNINRSFLISFWLKLIEFDLLNIIRTCFNWFHRDELKSSFKFRSKKSIKTRFDNNISWLVNLDHLDLLSLVIRVKHFKYLLPLFLRTILIVLIK